MFLHHCSSCEKRQMIFPSQIAGVAAAAGDRLSFSFTCWCGAEQTHVMAPVVGAPKTVTAA